MKVVSTKKPWDGEVVVILKTYDCWTGCEGMEEG